LVRCRKSSVEAGDGGASPPSKVFVLDRFSSSKVFVRDRFNDDPPSDAPSASYVCARPRFNASPPDGRWKGWFRGLGELARPRNFRSAELIRLRSSAVPEFARGASSVLLTDDAEPDRTGSGSVPAASVTLTCSDGDMWAPWAPCCDPPTEVSALGCQAPAVEETWWEGAGGVERADSWTTVNRGAGRLARAPCYRRRVC